VESGPDSRRAAKKLRSFTLTGFNGQPVIYFFESYHSKERKKGAVMVGELELLGFETKTMRGPSNMLPTQEMGRATVYILASALFMFPFLGYELFSVSLFLLFQL
jgi:hypothetical protein